MASYVIADIHGEYDMFMKLLEKIDFKASDKLYILGDVLDRGPYPIKTMLKLMEMPNIYPIVGNHELMALDGLRFLNQEITEQTVASVDVETIGNLISWQQNGSDTTLAEYRALDEEMRREIISFILEFSMYEEVSIGGKNYLLIHAGLGGYEKGKPIEQYSLKDIVWERANYNIQYFDDVITVTGHTPTQNIKENPKPGYIYKANNHIAIDCGSFLSDGRLAALRLDDGEEFYVEHS